MVLLLCSPKTPRDRVIRKTETYHEALKYNKAAKAGDRVMLAPTFLFSRAQIIKAAL